MYGSNLNFYCNNTLVCWRKIRIEEVLQQEILYDNKHAFCVMIGVFLGLGLGFIRVNKQTWKFFKKLKLL